MYTNARKFQLKNWKIEKIGIIGPGIVGMPMAAMLANARIRIGTDSPAKVVVIQRNSVNSGWKVDAINCGRSVIGGLEPNLNEIVYRNVKEGFLSASHDFNDLSDADIVIVSVQTDKKRFEPDYGPLFGALEDLARALQNKPPGKVPLVIFESTLAPTTMNTLIRNHFINYGLEEGKDILIGNSPNRVMPGSLVERIKAADKLAGGLHPETTRMISQLYKQIVTEADIFETNSLTAEIVKTLENAYRDVRIAFSTEIVRYCDKNNIDFYKLRDTVNERLSQLDQASRDPNIVPTGGILIPMLGVGGHCLPKDGILLLWRIIKSGAGVSNSLIMKARRINDESPIYTFRHAEEFFGILKNKKIALLGVAYRFNSEDTRNSPTLALANYLREEGIDYIMHDPFVKPSDQHLLMFDQVEHFTNDIDKAMQYADLIFLCTAHRIYKESFENIFLTSKVTGIMDACNIYSADYMTSSGINYTGIGRGSLFPPEELMDFAYNSFRAIEKGIAVELDYLIQFYNENYVHDEFNKVKFSEVQDLARTCSTRCEIVTPEKVTEIPQYKGFYSRLSENAYNLSKLMV